MVESIQKITVLSSSPTGSTSTSNTYTADPYAETSESFGEHTPLLPSIASRGLSLAFEADELVPPNRSGPRPLVLLFDGTGDKYVYI